MTRNAQANRSVNIPSVTDRELGRDKLCKDRLSENQLLRMFYELEMAITNSFIDEIETGNYSYIPYAHEAWRTQLMRHLGVRSVNNLRYLEIGCGIGTKLWLAHHIVKIPDVTGIEISPTYAKIAKHLCPWANIIVADARSYNEYSDYDVIYTYTPWPGCDELYERIEKQLKPGSLFVRPDFNTGIFVKAG